MHPVKAIKERAKDGPIKWPAMNLTLFSGVTLSIGAIAGFWGSAFKALFGFNPQDHPGATAAIFVGLVAAIGLIIAADLLARGIASSRLGDSAILPDGLKAKLNKDGEDEQGFTATSIRIAPGGSEVLLLKDGKDPTWYALGSENEQATLLSG